MFKNQKHNTNTLIEKKIKIKNIFLAPEVLTLLKGRTRTATFTQSLHCMSAALALMPLCSAGGL